MWSFLTKVILRYRVYNLIVIFLITAFLGYKAVHVQMTYEFPQMLPSTDSTSINYNNFREQFGVDGNILFVALEGENIFKEDVFRDIQYLSDTLANWPGVRNIISLDQTYELLKNDSLRKFEISALFKDKVKSQEDLDSLLDIAFSLPFYEGILYQKGKNIAILGITLNQDTLNTGGRNVFVNSIKDHIETLAHKNNLEAHFSGLPFIRTITSAKIEKELLLFAFLALVVAAIFLFLFFRSFKATFFPLIIVVIGVIWALGLISLFGYKITILSGMIPPLLIVIGVENCIFLLNKYHQEYKSHQNKVKALSRLVQRVGRATLLTNLTTAIGFAAFIVTGNSLLVEFGIIASINIFAMFILTLFLIPIVFSYIGPPKQRHIKHLDHKFTSGILEKVIFVITHRRQYVYITVAVLLAISIWGGSKLKTTGRVVDDIPHSESLYQDIQYFEEEFGGILPFEITIDTKKKKGIYKLSTLRKVSQLQDTLHTYSQLSKSLSIVDLVKFAKQSFYKGNPTKYQLPNNQEKNFILSYLPKDLDSESSLLKAYVDSNLQVMRVSVQMANITTTEIQALKDDLQPKMDSIFKGTGFDIDITGTSVVYLKGSDYLVSNLFTSLILALLAITLLMWLMFTTLRMVGVSLAPNLIPLFLTAALMGFLSITIKPSTVLIFSIALGISVDNAIHFLSRYRLHLKYNNFNIKESVIEALKETGFSMIYSSIVLFFGFGIFVLSTFGGTQAIGYLVSFTLIIAVLSNLFLLPSLLLTLDKKITTKFFQDPIIDLFDEDDDSEFMMVEKNK